MGAPNVVFGAHLTLRKEEVMEKLVELMDYTFWILWVRGWVLLASVTRCQLRMGMRPLYAVLLVHTLVGIPILIIGIRETKRVMRERKEAKK